MTAPPTVALLGYEQATSNQDVDVGVAARVLGLMFRGRLLPQPDQRTRQRQHLRTAVQPGAEVHRLPLTAPLSRCTEWVDVSQRWANSLRAAPHHPGLAGAAESSSGPNIKP